MLSLPGKTVILIDIRFEGNASWSSPDSSRWFSCKKKVGYSVPKSIWKGVYFQNELTLRVHSGLLGFVLSWSWHLIIPSSLGLVISGLNVVKVSWLCTLPATPTSGLELFGLPGAEQTLWRLSTDCKTWMWCRQMARNYQKILAYLIRGSMPVWMTCLTGLGSTTKVNLLLIQHEQSK